VQSHEEDDEQWSPDLNKFKARNSSDTSTVLTASTVESAGLGWWSPPVSTRKLPTCTRKLVPPQEQPFVPDESSEPVECDVMMRPVKRLARSVAVAVETVQERHRQATSRKRISRALLTLRAANELRYRYEQAEARAKDEDETERDLAALGSALFCPLDHAAIVRRINKIESPPLKMAHSDLSSQKVHSPTITPEPIPQVERIPVQILPEPDELLVSNPRLLSEEMFQQLVEEGVPECLHMDQWERIFSIGRDGDEFRTFLEQCENFKYTILVVKTTTGHIFGGFTSSPWKEQDGYTKRHSYYGTGMSFLFANHPLLTPGVDPEMPADKELMLFKWTGSNDFCQLCDRDRNYIAMGGKGAFGFIIEDNFDTGSTDRCGTFGNPPLTPDVDGTFSVASMEMYGLVPFGMAFGGLCAGRRSPVDPKSNAHSLIVHCDSFGNTCIY
jgi:hypothetical protein